ncbi:MAG TPA: glycopeptide resistance accessory protein VanW [Ruminococcaceae bacterium]|nr:glycopeptide resistance accessory protein VanW [Oscillospiraceae bacterium]
MARKRLTQIFPFLLPLRKWQRKKLFYLKMRLDGNKYAKKISEGLLPGIVFETSSLMLNENSGFDMNYQIGKVHNLNLAANTIDRVLIKPGETFSFWQLVRQADKYEPYKKGLNLADGKITASYGGGLCQLSNMLFWLFLHTPLTVTERHAHAVQFLPPAADGLPCGTDATVSEGWLDLKARNETDNTFQIEISFEGKFIYGRILSKDPVNTSYSVFNPPVSYRKQGDAVYQLASVCRLETDKESCNKIIKELYVNECEIAYKLSEDINIEKRGA